MSDKVTGVKTNGAVTRATMASGRRSQGNRHAINQRPRVNSPAGIAARAKRREATYEPRPGSCEGRFVKGFNKPGSLNPRKVGR